MLDDILFRSVDELFGHQDIYVSYITLCWWLSNNYEHLNSNHNIEYYQHAMNLNRWLQWDSELNDLWGGRGEFMGGKIFQSVMPRRRGDLPHMMGKNEVGKLHKSQQDFTRMEFIARQCGDKKKKACMWPKNSWLDLKWGSLLGKPKQMTPNQHPWELS